MAIVIATRIPIRVELISCPIVQSPSRWHGPQVAYDGLRTDGSLFRADLSAAVPTHAKEVQSVYCRNVAPVGDFHHNSIIFRI
jgi:hypothetical protein